VEELRGSMEGLTKEKMDAEQLAGLAATPRTVVNRNVDVTEDAIDVVRCGMAGLRCSTEGPKKKSAVAEHLTG
jgi:hypothetical protein